MKKIIALILGIILVLGLGAAAAFYFLIIGVIKGSEPYKMTVELVQKNEEVAKSLGPIQAFGFFPMGNVKVSNDAGEANIVLKVVGQKSSAKVQTFFFREGGKWNLNDAVIMTKGSSEWVPILPLEISSVTFHSESGSGPVNELRKYVLGETVYWTTMVEKAHRKGDEVSLKEGLTVLDSQQKVVVENPELVVFNEKTGVKAISFDNHATLPAAGQYTFKTLVTDRFSNRQVSREDSVMVVNSSTLKISTLNFRDQGPEGPVKEQAVYRQGEPIHVTFQVVGFTTKDGGISIAEDLYILDQNDQVILEKPSIIEVNEPWTAEDLLALQNKIDIPAAGKYKLKITVRDRNLNQDYTSLNDFSVEEGAATKLVP
ncbi:MAG: hypothetical protein HY541_06885 [Deltaproteobacteria bacterium]|nr:hypothetical protein [Deltaproteobacteria bacterium]